MGGPVGLQPLVGGDLVGADHLPYRVIEDLGRRPGQGGQAHVLEPAQVVDEGLPQAAGALGDLERGEPVHVDRRCGLLHRPGHVDVVVAVEVGVDPALEADLGGAFGHCLGHPLLDVLEREQVWLAAS